MTTKKELLANLNKEIQGQRTDNKFANQYQVGYNDGMEDAVAYLEGRKPVIIGDGSAKDPMNGVQPISPDAPVVVSPQREDTGNWLTATLGGYLGK